MLGNAGVNVAEVALAKVSFDAGDFGYGLMLASAGFGLVVREPERRRLDRAPRASRASTAPGFALMAIGIGAAAVAPNVWIAAACVVLSGVGERDRGRLQRAARPARRARSAARAGVHGADELELRWCSASGWLAAGPLTDEFGARWVWGVSACLSALAALVGYVLARGIRDVRVVEPDARERGGLVAKRREWTGETLAAGVREGDRRALARAITLVENGDPLAYELVREVYPDTGSAYVVGVTGPPGVGKSSLIAALVRQVREAGPHGRRRLGRPVEPLHAGRAARRPDPPLGALPRPGRLHPLDGDARPPRRARRGDAAGRARPRRRRQGHHLRRDGRHRARARSR